MEFLLVLICFHFTCTKKLIAVTSPDCEKGGYSVSFLVITNETVIKFNETKRNSDSFDTVAKMQCKIRWFWFFSAFVCFLFDIVLFMHYVLNYGVLWNSWWLCWPLLFSIPSVGGEYARCGISPVWPAAKGQGYNEHQLWSVGWQTSATSGTFYIAHTLHHSLVQLD